MTKQNKNKKQRVNKQIYVINIKSSYNEQHFSWPTKKPPVNRQLAGIFATE